MSQPIYVSPSTTLVQVNPLQIPYTVVYPNAVQIIGQTFTVLDTTSSIQVFDNPIVLSTINNNRRFVDGSFSTLINQPQGFLTLQAQSTLQWGFLNSYPFRNQYISAGTQFTTLNLLTSQILHANKTTLCTLNVENLNISGKMNISSGLFIDLGVSSLGAVTLVSSLFVEENVFFSSCLSTLGNFETASSFTVGGQFLAKEGFTTSNSVVVSSILSATQGITNAGYTQLEGNLVGTTHNVAPFTTGTNTSGNIGASAQIYGGTRSLSSFFIGRNIQTKTLSIDSNALFLSSATLNQSVIVASNLAVASNIYFNDTMGVGGNLFVNTGFTTLKPLIANSMDVAKTFTVGTINAEYADIYQTDIALDILGVSTQTNANYLEVDKDVGLQNLSAKSTIVGKSLSVGQTFVGFKDVFIQEGLFISSFVSTLREAETSSWASTLGHLSSHSIGSAEYLHVLSTLNVGKTLIANCNSESTIVTGALLINRDLTIRNVLTLSSYTLPSSLVTFNLEASTIHAAFLGQASSITTLQNLTTSSLVIGSSLNIQNTAENYLPFTVNRFSTFLFSSLLLQNTYQDNLDAERRYNALRITSSFGIEVTAAPNSFEVKPLGYLLSTSYAYQVISTAKVDGLSFSGTFQGDGAQLSNIMYPRNLSVGVSFISTLFTSNAFISSAFLSSGISHASTNLFSTLQVNTMNIWGNAYDETVPSSNIIVAFDSQRALILNNMYIQKPYLPQLPAFVTINPTKIRPGDIYPDIFQPGLEVGNTLRYTEMVGIPADSLIFNDFRAENLFVQHLGSNTFPTNLSNTMYISSGLIRASSTSFFIDQNTSYIQFSTNIIQPLFSTLVFNSTLFLERDTQRVGINQQPNATLDTRTIRLQGNVQVISSLIIDNGIQQRVTENTSLSNLWQQGPLTFEQDTPSFGKVQTNLTEAFTLVQTPLPTASSYPSFMNASSIYLSLNDVLYCDTRRNIGVNTFFDPFSSYQSTFTNSGLVRISTTTTSLKAESSGLFYSMATI